MGPLLSRLLLLHTAITHPKGLPLKTSIKSSLVFKPWETVSVNSSHHDTEPLSDQKWFDMFEEIRMITLSTAFTHITVLQSSYPHIAMSVAVFDALHLTSFCSFQGFFLWLFFLTKIRSCQTAPLTSLSVSDISKLVIHESTWKWNRFCCGTRSAKWILVMWGTAEYSHRVYKTGYCYFSWKSLPHISSIWPGTGSTDLLWQIMLLHNETMRWSDHDGITGSKENKKSNGYHSTWV